MSKKSYWNYRILAHEFKGEIYLKVHEVYYTNNKPESYTEDAVDVSGDNLKEIKQQLKMMKQDIKQDILWAGKKFPKKFKP